MHSNFNAPSSLCTYVSFWEYLKRASASFSAMLKPSPSSAKAWCGVMESDVKGRKKKESSLDVNHM
jgi:hypothetical protein